MRRGCRVPLGGSVIYGDGPPSPADPDPVIGGTPAPAGFRPGNWDFTRGEYTVAQGDTLWGLAITYLGQGSRWLDIWAMQTQPWGTKAATGGAYLNRFVNKPDPSSKNPGRAFMEGDVLIMPAAAVKAAKAYAQSENVQPQPTTPGAPGWQPGGGGGTPPKPVEPSGATVPILVGAAVLGAYLLVR